MGLKNALGPTITAGVPGLYAVARGRDHPAGSPLILRACPTGKVKATNIMLIRHQGQGDLAIPDDRAKNKHYSKKCLSPVNVPCPSRIMPKSKTGPRQHHDPVHSCKDTNELHLTDDGHHHRITFQDPAEKAP